MNINVYMDQIKIFPCLTNGGSCDVIERTFHKRLEFYSYLCYLVTGNLCKSLTIFEHQSPYLLNGENLSHEVVGEVRVK